MLEITPPALEDLCKKFRVFYDCTRTHILWSVFGVRNIFFVKIRVVITGLKWAPAPLMSWRYGSFRSKCHRPNILYGHQFALVIPNDPVAADGALRRRCN